MKKFQPRAKEVALLIRDCVSRGLSARQVGRVVGESGRGKGETADGVADHAGDGPGGQTVPHNRALLRENPAPHRLMVCFVNVQSVDQYLLTYK
jgi:hypothetical protein